jgi:hypothetical protein
MFDCEKEEDVLRHMIGDKKRDRDDDGGKLLDV